MSEGVPRDVADLVRQAAHRRPSATALVAGTRRLGWAALDAQVDACAAGLLDRGLAAGDRVALMLGNTPEFVIAYFGILRAGLVAVPLNTASTPVEVEWLLGQSGARLVVCDPVTGRVVREAIPAGSTCELVDVTLGAWEDLLRRGREADAAPAAVDPESLAVLLFTAGTSGRPKGAMLTHRALLADLAMVRDSTDPPAAVEGDVVLAVLPLFHVYGMNAVLGLAASVAATCVLVDRFDPGETLALIQREGVTNVPGAPPMYVAWAGHPRLRERVAGVRLFICGGAPLPGDLFDAFQEASGLPIWEGYGMTECAPVVATTLVSGAPKRGSVGRPLPGLDVRLLDPGGVDEDDDGDDQPPGHGDPGELWVRGPSLFSGYWPDGAGGPDADGWFNTGDVVYADAEGDLHLVDRRRELILVSGFNVYPREVELVIDALAEVAECAVVGRDHPYTGETVVAFVVPVPGVSLSSERVLAHCEERLARFKCPTVVTVVDSLPHSSTGKVAKGRLREVHGG
ncbi:MAG: AMP-binding protein [Candidatus Nanopelagicales bacterium]